MSMPTDTGATDVRGAGERIASLFKGPELERPTGEGETPSSGAPEEVAENTETTLETPESARAEGDTEEVSRRFKAKLGDREVEFELLSDDIDPDLVPKGLMMEADYRKKTMELGDNRKSLEAKQQELDAKFNEVAELLQFEVDSLESQEMLELKEYDPDAYWKKFEQLKGKAEKLNAWRDQKTKEIEKQQLELISAQSEKVTQLVPDWLDANRKEADLSNLKPYLSELGFNEQELKTIGAIDGKTSDARLLAMARKAMMFDKIQSQDIESKRIKPAAKSVEPTGGAKPNIEQDAMKAKRAKLRKSGKIGDAQAVFSELLKFK